MKNTNGANGNKKGIVNMKKLPKSKRKMKCSTVYHLYILATQMGYAEANKDIKTQQRIGGEIKAILNETELNELLAHVADTRAKVNRRYVAKVAEIKRYEEAKKAKLEAEKKDGPKLEDKEEKKDDDK